MKFGVGNWSKIIESNCLVGKTNAQMNLQTQRMLGQQSTAGKKITLSHTHTHTVSATPFGSKVAAEEEKKCCFVCFFCHQKIIIRVWLFCMSSFNRIQFPF